MVERLSRTPGHLVRPLPAGIGASYAAMARPSAGPAAPPPPPPPRPSAALLAAAATGSCRDGASVAVGVCGAAGKVQGAELRMGACGVELLPVRSPSTAPCRVGGAAADVAGDSWNVHVTRAMRKNFNRRQRRRTPPSGAAVSAYAGCLPTAARTPAAAAMAQLPPVTCFGVQLSAAQVDGLRRLVQRQQAGPGVGHQGRKKECRSSEGQAKGSSSRSSSRSGGANANAAPAGGGAQGKGGAQAKGSSSSGRDGGASGGAAPAGGGAHGEGGAQAVFHLFVLLWLISKVKGLGL